MGVIYRNGIAYGGGGGGTGTSDYLVLTNKPSINGITLTGNKLTEDLVLVDDTTITVDANHKLALKNPPQIVGNTLNI